MTAPAFNTNLPENTPSMLPLLFVTIACGAISGFHGLVASGTTSKQLDKETDLRFVGFGAIGEGSLSLATIACAGFATLADWEAVYSLRQGGVAAVEGGANIISQGVGLDNEIAETLLTVMAVLFAGTTMAPVYVYSVISSKNGVTSIIFLDAESVACDIVGGHFMCSTRLWCGIRRFRWLSDLAAVWYH